MERIGMDGQDIGTFIALVVPFAVDRQLFFPLSLSRSPSILRLLSSRPYYVRGGSAGVVVVVVLLLAQLPSRGTSDGRTDERLEFDY